MTQTRLIKEGTPDGSLIRFSGEGQSHGDVVFTLRYVLPKGFSILDGDLHYHYILTLQEWSRAQSVSIETPNGHQLEVPYQPLAVDPSSVRFKGEGLPIAGHPVRCEGFFVTSSLRREDTRSRGCDEKIPLYLEGYCLCDGRKVWVRNEGNPSRRLLSCSDPSRISNNRDHD